MPAPYVAALSHARHLPAISSRSSPEHLSNDPFTDKSDVYSLGAALWELLTLRVPWEGHTAMQIMMAVGLRKKSLADTLPGEAEVAPALRPLRRAVIACLHAEPARRPAAAEAAAALTCP